jgi:hypothetical protein
MDGFGMIFKALGVDPQAFILAIQEIQSMALSIAQKTAATDDKMARIEHKVDALMSSLKIDVPHGYLSAERAGRIIEGRGHGVPTETHAIEYQKEADPNA